MVSKPVEELDAAEVLDAVEGWHGRLRELEAWTFVAAAHFADLQLPARRVRV